MVTILNGIVQLHSYRHINNLDFIGEEGQKLIGDEFILLSSHTSY